MLEALNKSNHEWEQQYSVAPGIVHSRPFWEVIVLHPLALRPNGEPLCTAKDRFFLHRSTPPPPIPDLRWELYYPIDDQLYLNRDRSQPLPPFVAMNTRNSYNCPPISSLAMIVNSNSKLQKFIADHHGGDCTLPRVMRYSDLLSRLVEAIFFVPVGLNLCIGLSAAISTRLPRPLTPEEIIALQKVKKEPAETNTAQSPESANTTGLKRKRAIGPAHGIMEEDREASISAVEDTSSLVEFPEVPDADGLTGTEFRMVMERACDPHLNSNDCADAAMLMMFGTQRYEKPYIHGSQDIYG